MKNISKYVPTKLKKSIKIINVFLYLSKRNLKKLYCSEKLLKFQGNAKEKWEFMKQ